MRIAISAVEGTLESQVEPRFGRAPYFVIYDLETGWYEAVPNPAVNSPGGAGIQAAQFVLSRGVNAVISGHFGPWASQTLGSAGVELFTVSGGTVKEAIEKFKRGELNRWEAQAGAGPSGGFGAFAGGWGGAPFAQFGGWFGGYPPYAFGFGGWGPGFDWRAMRIAQLEAMISALEAQLSALKRELEYLKKGEEP
ncbi:MAG: NifB/NifX family molybdenum-iron cluster-binding protein [Synergistetes bacterium]|nr:NifB/NifX family molybdenum-iron cluster-binding protein [Synergistota bacterium]